MDRRTTGPSPDSWIVYLFCWMGFMPPLNDTRHEVLIPKNRFTGIRDISTKRQIIGLRVDEWYIPAIQGRVFIRCFYSLVVKSVHRNKLNMQWCGTSPAKYEHLERKEWLFLLSSLSIRTNYIWSWSLLFTNVTQWELVVLVVNSKIWWIFYIWINITYTFDWWM